MAIVFYHSKSGKQIPAHGPTPAGYMRAEELVDVRNGHRVWISCEPSVNSGQGVAQALSLVRDDAGHEGETAFMRVEMYDRLSADERKRLLQAPVSVPKSSHENRIAELEAQLAAARAQSQQPSQPRAK